MTVYFAYGANMDPVHMAECCPAAERLGRAILPGHRFAIAAGGFGTVHAEPGSAVQGVLWRLSPEDEQALDGFEGIADGFYRKRVVEVRSGGCAPRAAMIYYAADPAPGRPAPGYLERIIEVGRELGFPEEYLEGLGNRQ